MSKIWTIYQRNLQVIKRMTGNSLKIRPLLFCLLFCAGLLAACDSQTQTHSDLFYKLFVDDSTTFRGTNLGSPLWMAYQNEQPIEPAHRDDFGLKYEFDLDMGRTLHVDYFPQRMKMGETSERISSIVANVLLPTEVETARLYGEIQTHFDKLYEKASASGAYGNYTWNCSKTYISSMEVRLNLDEDKKGITINFIDTQTGFIQDTLATASNNYDALSVR